MMAGAHPVAQRRGRPAWARASPGEQTEQRLRLTLFPKQAQFVHSQTPFSSFVGGIGSGKTRGGVARCILYSARNPGSLVLVTAPTFPMLRDATLRAYFELWPESRGGFLQTEMRLKLPNGSETLFRSTDDPEHLRGPNLGAFYMDEAAQSPHLAFQILQGRLRQQGMPHQGWITTTPKGMNWVYQEFAARTRSDYEFVPCSARENPFLPKEFLRRLEESYAGDFALQEIEGQFVIIGGKAFFASDALKELLEYVEAPRETLLGGAVRVWKRAMVSGKYVAGGDLAWGETGAYSCLTVLDWATGDAVAEIHGRLAADEMALEAVKLCRQYNDAYALVEANGEGINIVNRMVDLGYGPRMYSRDGPASRPSSHSRYGWITDGVTRPVMLGELEEAVRGRAVRVHCSDAMSEMMSFVRDDRGRPGHAEGAYDDHVISLALAWQARHYARYSVFGKQAVSLEAKG